MEVKQALVSLPSHPLVPTKKNSNRKLSIQLWNFFFTFCGVNKLKHFSCNWSSKFLVSLSSPRCFVLDINNFIIAWAASFSLMQSALRIPPTKVLHKPFVYNCFRKLPSLFTPALFFPWRCLQMHKWKTLRLLTWYTAAKVNTESLFLRVAS